MKYSHQRELILSIVKATDEHPTADTIYECARQTEPSISLGTIYRNLKLLSDEKIIITLETVDKKTHYDGDTTPHLHFICEKCNRIFDFPDNYPVPPSITDAGHTVTDKKYVYYGICVGCSKNSL
ncbi:MAG: transcriptional repressor [Firmicutes bacterium]|nr:transcriptional repressor [Bacillota bacterium]